MSDAHWRRLQWVLVWTWFCCLFPLAARAQQEAPQNAVFVFGDSLSDVGNAAGARDAAAGLFDFTKSGAYTLGLCHPSDDSCEDLLFDKSRVSNGPLAIEHLAEGLGAAELLPSFHLVPLAGVDRSAPFGSNYAVASAKARGSGPEDLAAQIDAALLDQRRGEALPSEALYVIEIGGNDAIDALQAVAASVTDAGGSETPMQIIDAAVHAVADNVERLIGAGAHYVLVLNVPNIGALPAVRNAVDGFQRVVVRRLAALVARTYNAQLWWQLREVQLNHPSARVEVFDLYTEFEIVRARAFFEGRNYKDACFDSELYFDTGVRIFDEACAPEPGARAPDFEQFLFWDELHPTERVHEEVGEALIAVARDMLAGS